MDFMTIKQASEKWGICTRRVQTLCTEGRIDGAERLGHQWVIPINAEKPKDARIKSGRYIKTKIRKWRERRWKENRIVPEQ